MKAQCIRDQLEFHGLGRRVVVGQIDGGKISSDTGSRYSAVNTACETTFLRYAVEILLDARGNENAL